MYPQTDDDLLYLREKLLAAPFVPYAFGGEDKNIAAFRSKADLIAWYCQPPGVDGEPYRDRGFYTRELAMLSRIIKPLRIVEFGTSLGIGTCMLNWLNPEAAMITIDCDYHTFMPGDIRVMMGHLAIYEAIPHVFYVMKSWEYQRELVDLCFIDADHSYAAVIKDSETAWLNRSRERSWAIAWHDHNIRHVGVMKAVGEFCASKGIELQSRPDSDTVWVWGNLP